MERDGAITFEALERRLGVRRRAQEDAAADRPEPQSDALSPVEREITAAIDAARRRLAGERENAAAPTEIAAARFAAAPEESAATLAQAELALTLAEERARAAFRGASAEAERAEQDLAAFKAAQGLRRDPHYPKSGVLAVALLMLVAFFEAAFSASLFDRDVEGGLVAALAVAGGLGAANVTLGFLGGYLGLRYLQHRSRAQKAAGALALLLAAGFAIGLNLYAAQWRDAAHRVNAAAVENKAALEAAAKLQACEAQVAAEEAAMASDEAWNAAIARCRARHAAASAPAAPAVSFLGFAAPEAVVLLMLGVGVWAFAALKGFSGVDDPYPDYGKLHRGVARAKAKRESERAAFLEELAAPVEAAMATLEAQSGARRAGLAEVERAFDAAAERLATLGAEERRLDQTEAALISLYRKENARRRRSAAPAYFAEGDPPRQPPADALARAGAAVAQARAALARGEAEVAARLKGLTAALQAARARLEAEA